MPFQCAGPSKKGKERNGSAEKNMFGRQTCQCACQSRQERKGSSQECVSTLYKGGVELEITELLLR